VVSYSAGKKSLAEHEPALAEARTRLERARGLFLMLAEEDAAAYGLVNELSRLPEGDARRAAELPGAVLASVRVPEATMAASVDVLRLMVDLAPITNRRLRSDLGIAAELAEAAARSSAWNVLINAVQLPGGEAQAARTRCDESLAAARSLRERVAEACRV
jgi:formiminotetrahydrofolate cyclodeaminase